MFPFGAVGSESELTTGTIKEWERRPWNGNAAETTGHYDVQSGHPCAASATDVKIQVVIFTALFIFFILVFQTLIGENILGERIYRIGNVQSLFLKSEHEQRVGGCALALCRRRRRALMFRGSTVVSCGCSRHNERKDTEYTGRLEQLYKQGKRGDGIWTCVVWDILVRLGTKKVMNAMFAIYHRML